MRLNKILKNALLVISAGIILTACATKKEVAVEAPKKEETKKEETKIEKKEEVTKIEKIAGQTPEPLDYGNIPGCTYCSPEVASVGMTEDQAKEAGHEIKVGKFPFSASGKASSRLRILPPPS